MNPTRRAGAGTDEPIAPIFLVEGDDVIILDSLVDAQNFVEPQDVDVGIAHDARGRRLQVTTDGTSTFISLAESEPSRPAELEAVLRRYLKWLGDPAASMPGCDLSCLVEASRRYVVAPPGRRFQDWVRRVRRRLGGNRRAGER
jgi:hypothetical protein